jgi:hypothetical protein
MKTLEEIFNQAPVYLHEWKTKKDVISAFEDFDEEESQAIAKWNPFNILFASYGLGDYSGQAFVLFEHNQKLYEVNASHCSCYQLEGQFDPEETTVEALKLRLTEGEFGKDDWYDNGFHVELKNFLGIKDA